MKTNLSLSSFLSKYLNQTKKRFYLMLASMSFGSTIMNVTMPNYGLGYWQESKETNYSSSDTGHIDVKKDGSRSEERRVGKEC